MLHLQKERSRFRELEKLAIVARSHTRKSKRRAETRTTAPATAAATLFIDQEINHASLDGVLRAFADEVQVIRREEGFSGRQEDLALLARSLSSGQRQRRRTATVIPGAS